MLEHQVDPRSNPAIGVFRFFVWLMPTAIVIACFALIIWIDSNYLGSILAIILGFVACLLCGWFDSMLALPCRLGKRHRGLHITLFILVQGFFVVPALLFATVYAICAANPW